MNLIYTEDKFAKNIAKHIVARRTEKPIETTFELNDVIKAAIPMKCRINGGHPAKRTFQAIRIELNHELDVLESSIDTMIDRLNADGRLCIITFHSLEDRIVKVMRTQVHVHQIFRYVYVERNQRERLLQENRYFRLKKNLVLIHVRKVLS